MIIRNGFVRTIDGEWMSLAAIHRILVDDLTQVHGTPVFQVFAFLKGVEDDYDIIQLSDVYENEDDAHCALDDMFGYNDE